MDGDQDDLGKGSDEARSLYRNPHVFAIDVTCVPQELD